MLLINSVMFHWNCLLEKEQPTTQHVGPAAQQTPSHNLLFILSHIFTSFACPPFHGNGMLFILCRWFVASNSLWNWEHNPDDSIRSHRLSLSVSVHLTLDICINILNVNNLPEEVVPASIFYAWCAVRCTSYLCPYCVRYAWIVQQKYYELRMATDQQQNRGRKTHAKYGSTCGNMY